VTTDIFQFWAQVRPAERVHPEDRPVLDRLGKSEHGFDLCCLPGPFRGPLLTAPVVLLYLAPGLRKEYVEQAKSAEFQAFVARTRGGREDLPIVPFLESRTKCFGDLRDLRSKVAQLNICAYRSKRFKHRSLLAALPSSRASLDWAQKVLFPEAIEGKRVVVCLRAARYWGLKEGKRYGQGLYAPDVTIAGHMERRGLRDEVVRAVKMAVNA
jgi:hypothetical protein